MFFYLATLTWELAFFEQTKNNKRIAPDTICAALFLFGSLVCEETWYPFAVPLITLLWLASRQYAWNYIVFTPTTDGNT